MNIERAEWFGRVVAVALGVILLTLALTMPTWWGVLGLVPLGIAFTGW